MSDQVAVSSVEVQRARLLVRLDAELGDMTPDYVVKIAEAQPVNGSRHHGRTINETSIGDHG